MIPPQNPLTRREITILRYVAQGWSAGAIARQLRVSQRTIHFFFANIKSKLNSRTMQEVMFIAGRDGLLGEYEPGDEV